MKHESSKDFHNPNNKTSRRGFLKMIGGLVGVATVETLREGKDLISFYEFLKKLDQNKPGRDSVPGEIDQISEVFSKDPNVREFGKTQRLLINEWPSAESHIPPREQKSAYEYKRENSKFEYLEKVPEPEIRGDSPFENPGKFGLEKWHLRFIQAFRFQPLTMAVERKYNLPRNLMLAMLIQESMGEEFLPNAKGDGGFGLLHMQFGTANEFGVSVFKNCPAIVCDGKDKRSCVDEDGNKLDHAGELNVLMRKYKNDREHLTRIDGRLHHLRNIDAAGRMSAFHISRYSETLKTLPKELQTLGPLRAAICKYSGSKNFPEYWERIRVFMSLLSDERFLNGLFDKMKDHQEESTINGQPLNFINYIQEWQIFTSLNYGLPKYVQEACYSTPYSKKILETYPNVLGEVDEGVLKKYLD